MKVAGLGLEDLAALVCTTLDQHGINVVLTGGSCVSVWTHNAYMSLDLDFIALGLHSNREIGKALRTIGFTARTANGRYFEHPGTDLVIEFPSGPLMVGDEQVREEHIDKRATDMGVVRLLSPTDCIKDRLAGYYHWRDAQNFEQAVAVARRHAVDWKDLQRWHREEGVADQFAAFKTASETPESH